MGKSAYFHSGDAAEDDPMSKWPYFSQLLFLKDTVKPRCASGNLPKVRKSTLQTEDEDASQSSSRRVNEEGNESSQFSDDTQTDRQDIDAEIDEQPTTEIVTENN